MHFLEQENGVMRRLLESKTPDHNIVSRRFRFVHVIENGKGIVYGVGKKQSCGLENGFCNGGVLKTASFEKVSVNLTEVFGSLAFLKNQRFWIFRELGKVGYGSYRYIGKASDSGRHLSGEWSSDDSKFHNMDSKHCYQTPKKEYHKLRSCVWRRRIVVAGASWLIHSKGIKRPGPTMYKSSVCN